MTDSTVMVPIEMVKAVADAVMELAAGWDAPEPVIAGAIMCGTQAALDALFGAETSQ